MGWQNSQSDVTLVLLQKWILSRQLEQAEVPKMSSSVISGFKSCLERLFFGQTDTAKQWPSPSYFHIAERNVSGVGSAICSVRQCAVSVVSGVISRTFLSAEVTLWATPSPTSLSIWLRTRLRPCQENRGILSSGDVSSRRLQSDMFPLNHTHLSCVCAFVSALLVRPSWFWALSHIFSCMLTYRIKA